MVRFVKCWGEKSKFTQFPPHSAGGGGADRPGGSDTQTQERGELERSFESSKTQEFQRRGTSVLCARHFDPLIILKGLSKIFQQKFPFVCPSFLISTA